MMLQSHARAIRHSDDEPSRAQSGFRWLQSHARAIRHSDVAVIFDQIPSANALQSHARAIRHSDLAVAAATGRPRYRYNPTLGQSVIPTLAEVSVVDNPGCYNPTLGQSVIPTFAASLRQNVVM